MDSLVFFGRITAKNLKKKLNVNVSYCIDCRYADCPSLQEVGMNILFFLTPKEKVSHIFNDDTLRQVVEKMEFHGYSAIPLLDKEGKYIGTITEGDLLWYLKDHDFPDIYQLEDIPITDIERKRDNNAVNIQVSMEELFEKVTNQNFVPVVDDNNVFIGIITRKDIILYLANKDNAN